MKKLILVLLLPLSVFGQTSIPGSGALSLSTIKTVMYNLGEISEAQRDGATNIATLNAASHLSDKTAPFNVSDWYSYASVGPNSINVGAYGTFFSGTCTVASFQYNTTLYYTGTLQVGTVLYTDSGMTTFPPTWSYDYGGMIININVSGQVISTCSP